MVVPTEHSKDAALVASIRAGDPRAFEQLIEKHAGLVYSIARAHLRDHESAEESLLRSFG